MRSENTANVDQCFWTQVWRCTHRHPCKRCCWPWRPALLRAAARHLVPGYGMYSVRESPRLVIPAHRMALAVQHHALFLPFGQRLPACHLCDFASCCNYAHLVLGTPRDNIRGTAQRGWSCAKRKPVMLPDGTTFFPWEILMKVPPGLGFLGTVPPMTAVHFL